MIAQISALLGGIYEAVGPGLVLAAALPILLILLGFVAGEGLRRMRSDRS